MGRFDRDGLVARLREVVGEDGVRLDEPMAAHTTFGIGGPADVYVMPATPGELCSVTECCRELGAPCFVLGRGSNLLVDDAGFRGVIIALAERLRGVEVVGERIVAQAGATLSDVTEAACEHGLTGLEFACGIPGTVGGACFMNAGAYGGCVGDVLASVDVLRPDGTRASIVADELAFGYRASRVRTDGLVVLAATFALAPGEVAQIRATMGDLTQRRAERQPLELPSAGSTFKRPAGHFAGKLIMDAGLKGYRVGGAAVSERHAGFVVNLGGATAADVREVIAHVQGEVRRQFGVELEPELRFLGPREGSR